MTTPTESAAQESEPPRCINCGYLYDSHKEVQTLCSTARHVHVFKVPQPPITKDAPAPDLGALGEQADAWIAVTEVLNRVSPDWQGLTKRGIDSAVLAIEALATPAPAQDSRIRAWMEVCNTLEQLCPEWLSGPESGIECAIRAIKKLASPPLQPTPTAQQVINQRAIEALKHGQQCDENGEMIQVSRQALDEALAFIESCRTAQGELAELRVLSEEDSFCPCCGHNRDTSSVSTIDMGDGYRKCQKCDTFWREVVIAAQDVPRGQIMTDAVKEEFIKLVGKRPFPEHMELFDSANIRACNDWDAKLEGFRLARSNGVPAGEADRLDEFEHWWMLLSKTHLMSKQEVASLAWGAAIAQQKEKQ